MFTSLYKNWVWRRFAKNHIPRQGWRYDQNNGVIIVIPTITHEAWLRTQRKWLFNSDSSNDISNPIERMRMGHVRNLGSHSYRAPYFLFTDREDYNYVFGDPIRIVRGKAGTTLEFSLFCQHFVMERASIEVPSHREVFHNLNAANHAPLGLLKDPAAMEEVIWRAEELGTEQWERMLA